MFHRRNITVYSTRLGKVTIEHESSKGSSGPDLLLSYHDNEHYNSIRVCSVTKPPPPIKYYVSPYIRPVPMDENDDNEDSRESDSEMKIEDKISNSRTTVAATVSPVSSPDVDMNETETPDGQNSCSMDKEKVHAEALISMDNDEKNILQNEILPPMKTGPISDCELRKTNDQENIVSDVVAPVDNDSNTDTEVHQIPSNCPNDATDSPVAGNDQTVPMDSNDHDGKNDRAPTVVASDGQIHASSSDQQITGSSDQPVMDGIFQVLQI